MAGRQSARIKVRPRALVAIVVVAVIVRSVAASQATRDSPGQLQLVVESDSAAYRAGENPTFTIAFRNTGPNNLLLNGGALLGNGAQIWSAITCEFRTGDRRRIPLALSWGVSGVAGRIYFLGVPLRSGASHTIAVAASDYYVSQGPLPPGVHGLLCTYTGTQSRVRASTELPPCWEGTITSAEIRFRVGRAARIGADAVGPTERRKLWYPPRPFIPRGSHGAHQARTHRVTPARGQSPPAPREQG